MDYMKLEAVAMPVLISGLVLFMGFIVWDLARKSKAGGFGTSILFLALGLGVVGFVIKTLAVALIE
ncbi:DUF2788 domain-containing protein [Marinospirillum minutulum]|uniref:DUF2788 domain-containing protein n=1 Tax=Marinospirillum minutulum TaxID=64974 RepID=UPI0004237F5B|nr:DUF2788 domain-containing protein [Marinospirillum minutulum]